MDEFKRKYVRTALATLLGASLLGLVAGLLYRQGLIGSDRAWVGALEWVAKVELDKVSFAFVFFGALYVAVWALLSKLANVYSYSKWILIKCCLGVSVVPIFLFAAGWLIAPLTSVRPLALFVGLEGLMLATFWAYVLP